MKTIEEINQIAPYDPLEWQQGYGIWQSGYIEGQKNGATEQKEIDSVEITELRKERDAYYDRLQELREELAQKDEEEGKALLYAVDKTTERVKKEITDKACEWLSKQLYTDEGGCLASEWYQQLEGFIEGFRKAMEAETCNSDKNLQELTWEDVQRIVKIYQSTGQLTKQGWLKDREEIYKEVLKQFKEESK